MVPVVVLAGQVVEMTAPPLAALGRPLRARPHHHNPDDNKSHFSI